MGHRKPSWAKKVSPAKIRRLYEQNAKGIYDEEFIDDVGIGLLARCDSMLMATSSNLGKAICIECRTEMPHGYQRDFLLQCPKCGWSITFGEYNGSYKGQTLNGVGALPELKEFATIAFSLKVDPSKWLSAFGRLRIFRPTTAKTAYAPSSA